MDDNVQPLFERTVIYDDRRNLLWAYELEIIDPVSGDPTDLTHYAFAGAVTLKRGGAVVADIEFTNDLTKNRVIAWLNNAESKKAVDAAISASQTQVFWDIKGTPTDGEPEPIGKGESTVEEVSTP